MQIVVTGASGFIGSHITRQLLRSGHRVIAIARRPEESWLASSIDTKLETISTALEILDHIPSETEAIVHSAATSPAAGVGLEALIRDNAMATERLCRVAERAGVPKVIYLSSLSVYGMISQSNVDEATPICGPDAYGLTKRLGELSLAERAHCMSSVAIRLPGVVGRGAARHWLASLVARAKAGSPLRIFNPESAFNNGIHVEDLAEFIAQIIELEWLGFDAINVGAGTTLSITDIAKRVATAFGSASKIEIVPSKSTSFIVSSERAKRLYEYVPSPMESILARYLDESQDSEATDLGGDATTAESSRKFG